MQNKFRKLLRIVSYRDPFWFRALRYGVAAGAEHVPVLKTLSCNSVVDIGSSRGQFALAARHSFPTAKIFSFEPQRGAAAVFSRLFAVDGETVLNNAAIGHETKQCTMHVSGRDDSSSLLPMSSLQEELFPGTSEVETIAVKVAPLDSFLRRDDISAPALLKLDVQGFELDALRGCESLLANFEWIYCECSFVELYLGQKLAADVIEWLSDRNFRIEGIYHSLYDRDGKAIQADFLFRAEQNIA